MQVAKPMGTRSLMPENDRKMARKASVMSVTTAMRSGSKAGSMRHKCQLM